MAKASEKKWFLVTSPDGDWLYKPVQAETATDAVVIADEESLNPESVSNQYGGNYDVYEVVSNEPIKLHSVVHVTSRDE